MWIAWRLMAGTRAALADNLAAIFPGESRGALERRALRIFRSYARDVIDFLLALTAPRRRAGRTVRRSPSRNARFFDDLRAGAAASSSSPATSATGKWAGSCSRQLGLPLTIVAMAEARSDRQPDPPGDPRPNRRRHDRGPPDARDRAADPAMSRREPRRRDARRPALRAGPRAGPALRPAAWFLRTPFVMGHVTGAPVLPCSVERLGPGRFAVRPGTPIYLATDVPRDQAIARAAQLVADTLGAAHPRTSGVLVSLLPVLGRTAGRVRGPWLRGGRNFRFRCPLPASVCVGSQREDVSGRLEVSEFIFRVSTNNTFANGVPSAVFCRETPKPRRSNRAAHSADVLK